LRRGFTFATALGLLTVILASSATSAYAQTTWSQSGWVSSATVADLTGTQALAQGQPLLAGHSYNVTLEVNVPSTSTSTKNFSMSLNPRLLAASGQSVFWVVHNPSYPGYNSATFVGGSKTVTMNYIQGQVHISAYFQVPVNFTTPSAVFVTPSGNVTQTLNLPQNNVVLISVVPVGTTSTGGFAASVSDQTIQSYSSNYNQTSALVPSGKIPSAYGSLVNSLLKEAQALNTLGLPDQGNTLLGAISSYTFPTPPSNSLQTELLGGLAATVIVIILLAVLVVRSRGKSGYSSTIINDVQKDLAVLEVTAAKYDKAMADKLKSVRDKLSESS
jgi:hypothetical protein